jgi:exosortase
MASPASNRLRADTLFFAWSMVALAGLILIPLGRAWALAPDLGHGWAAPMLIGFLYWDRWPQKPSPAAPRERPGLPTLIMLGLVIVAAVPIRLTLTPFPLWPTALLLYTGLLIGAGLLLVHYRFGAQGIRWFAAPWIILMGAVPWPGVIETHLILPLREGIATVVAELSNALGQPALAVGTVLQIGHGWVGIDEACGGIRSLQAAVTSALFFGEWLRLSFKRRLALLVVGVVAAIMGNFGRVSFLAWCGSHSQEMIGRWHDLAGWIALAFTLIVTGTVPYFWKQSPQVNLVSPQRSVDSPRLKVPPLFGVRSTLVVFVVVALGVIEGGTRIWYSQGDTLQGAARLTWTANLPVSNLSFKANQLDAYADEMLRPDSFQSGSWRGPDRLSRMANYIEWHRGQTARFAPFVHNPTLCLPYSGFELEESLGTIQVPWLDTTIPFQSYVFSRGTDELVVAFTVWDPLRNAPLTEPDPYTNWVNWFSSRWREVRDAREHQPAQLLAFGIADRNSESLLPAELQSLLIAPSKVARSR